MSREVLRKTVIKAMEDTRFRSQLLKDPKGTLSGLDLTREEFLAIAQLTNESYEFVVKNVDPKALMVGTVGVMTTGTTVRENEAMLSRYNLTDLDKLMGK